MPNNWSRYVRRITGDATGRAIAQRLGVPESKVSYWRSATRLPSVSEAIDFARCYARPPLEGLVAAGYLEADDLEGPIVVNSPDIEQFTDVELADELLRRATARTPERTDSEPSPDGQGAPAP